MNDELDSRGTSYKKFLGHVHEKMFDDLFNYKLLLRNLVHLLIANNRNLYLRLIKQCMRAYAINTDLLLRKRLSLHAM